MLHLTYIFTFSIYGSLNRTFTLTKHPFYVRLAYLDELSQHSCKRH